MEELWENSPKKIEENITEVISDKSSDSDNDSEGSYEEMSEFERIGVILMQYEDVLDEENIQKMIKIGLQEDEDTKYVMKTISNLIKKYKQYDIINELINEIFSSKIFMLDSFPEKIIIDDKERFDFEIKHFEMIIDDYYDVLKKESIIIYLKQIHCLKSEKEILQNIIPALEA